MSPKKKKEAEDEDELDWDDIIPEDFRRAMEEAAKNREIEDLYLPPRRKTQTQSGSGGGDNKEGKKEKSGQAQKRKKPEVESEEESEESGEDRPKKRGRPPLKEKLLNFTDAELRRFIRSYKKFPAPLKRLEAIACDAELQVNGF